MLLVAWALQQCAALYKSMIHEPMAARRPPALTPPSAAAVSRASAGAAASGGTGPGTRKGARERASGPRRLGNRRLPSDARCDGSDSALALFFFELVVEVAADEVHEILSDFRGLFIAQPDEAYGRDQRRIKR